jgi:hypothetical protein
MDNWSVRFAFAKGDIHRSLGQRPRFGVQFPSGWWTIGFALKRIAWAMPSRGVAPGYVELGRWPNVSMGLLDGKLAVWF